VRIAIVLVLFAACAFAQDQAAVAAAEAGCGPTNVRFDAKEDTNQHPVPQPDSGKALVYVVQELGEVQCTGCALSKVGVDGNWVGANQGASYFSFPVDPGEHHLCVNWQSRFEWRSRAVALANFTAEPGKVYYFRTRLFSTRTDYLFDLDLVNSDQGKFLVASSAFSVSHLKN
jgi:hypothetical protein